MFSMVYLPYPLVLPDPMPREKPAKLMMVAISLME
jgi:hypothetical protein